MNYTFVIAASFIGFLILAGILLVPIWMFLKRQEKEADEDWSLDSDLLRRSSLGRTSLDSAREEKPQLPHE